MQNFLLTLVILLSSFNVQAYDISNSLFKSAEKELVKESRRYAKELSAPSPISVPAIGSIEVAFSPNEGAQELVIKVINSARADIKMLAYSFTSAPIVDALLKAKKRGVDIQLVVDKKSNISEDRSGKARSALSALANAGIDVRTIDAYAIHHDKLILVDSITVETGSFNYSAAAEKSNSENVIVNWNNSALAKVYTSHFERNYRQSERFTSRY